jgi:hypothetical protein
MIIDQTGETDFTKALSVLFFDCLRATSDDRVLILYDSALDDFFEEIVRFLISKTFHTTFVEVPNNYQHALLSWSAAENEPIVPAPLAAAIGEATVILNCLKLDTAAHRFRRAILETPRLPSCRMAHMPGVSTEVFSVLSRTPIQQIVESAELVAWALGEGSVAQLVTSQPDGTPLTLEIDLGGWTDEPIMSTGVIHAGAWGNIPPAEVFCCPRLGRVNGKVAINGSLPGHVLEHQDAIVLSFTEGKLTSWEAANSPITEYFDTLRESALQTSDTNWNVFAELGIGLNRAITTLTGNPLLDEKAYGTVHIAIGDNKAFGREVASNTHIDMVTVGATLNVNNIDILSNRVVNLDSIRNWRADLRLAPIKLDPQSRLLIRRTRISTERARPLRRLKSGGRIGYLPLCDASDDLLVKRIVSHLDETEATTYRKLKEAIQYDRLDEVLALLQHYSVLEVEADAHSRTIDPRSAR